MCHTSTCSLFLWHMNTQYCRVALAWQRYSFHNEVTMGLGRARGVGEGGGQIDSVKLSRLSQYLIVVCVCQFATYLLLIMLNAKYTWNQFKRSEIRLIELTKDGSNRAHQISFPMKLTIWSVGHWHYNLGDLGSTLMTNVKNDVDIIKLGLQLLLPGPGA